MKHILGSSVFSLILAIMEIDPSINVIRSENHASDGSSSINSIPTEIDAFLS